MPFPETISYSEPEPTAENTYSYPEGEPEWYTNFTGPGLSPEGEPAAEGEPFAATISDPTTMTIMSSIAGVMSCVIILENILVLYVIAKKWPKQNPTMTYFIIHLACADLIAGCQFLWFNCIDVHLRITRKGYWVLGLCGLWMIAMAASIGGILNFASLRVHVLKNAMKNEKFSKRRGRLSIALSWLFPLLVLFLPPMLGWNCVDSTQGSDCSQAIFPFKKSYVLTLACLLILAMFILAGYYIAIYYLVTRRLRSVKHISTSSRCLATERRLFATTMMIVSLFFICQAPVAVIMIADFVITGPCIPLIDAFQIILTFSFLNNILNPLVYYWGMPATRDAFWLAFGVRHRTRSGQQQSNTSKSRDKTEILVSDMACKGKEIPTVGRG